MQVVRNRFPGRWNERFLPRLVYYDLDELSRLGTISHDKTTHVYKSKVVANPQVFTSKDQYEVALAHSRNLLNSLPHEPGHSIFDDDQMWYSIVVENGRSWYSWTSALLFGIVKSREGDLLMEHFRSGEPELFSKIKTLEEYAGEQPGFDLMGGVIPSGNPRAAEAYSAALFQLCELTFSVKRGTPLKGTCKECIRIETD